MTHKLMELQRKLCDAFGLDNVITMDLLFDVKSTPIVKVTFWPNPDQIDAACALLKEYELKEREP